MQQLTNIKKSGNLVNNTGKVAITTINKLGTETLNKESDNVIQRKLIKAEEQIKEGRTVKASEVFKELEEEFGF